jgi:hypothetical protein
MCDIEIEWTLPRIARIRTQINIPGLAAIASRRGKSAAITNVNNDE